VRRATFLTGAAENPGDLPDVSWYAPDGGPVAWDRTSHSLSCLFGATDLDDEAARHVILLVHAGPDAQKFVLPPSAKGIRWRLFIDTFAETPADIFPDVNGPPPPKGPIRLEHHSLRCYVSETRSSPPPPEKK
jgi:glycogen operon protein